MFDDTNILAQIEDTNYKAIEVALEHKDKSIFHEFLNHYFRVLYLALSANDTQTILRIMQTLTFVYIKTIGYSRTLSSYVSIKNETSHRISSNLHHLIQGIGYRFNSDKNTEENKALLSLYETCFTSYSRFIYHHIMNLDWDNLELAFNDLNNSSPDYATNYHSVEADLWDEFPETKEVPRQKEVIEFNTVKRKPNELWMNTRLGLLYWGVLLYEIHMHDTDDMIVKMDADSLLKLWRFSSNIDHHFGIQNNLDNLATVINAPDYLSMYDWDYKDRLSGQVYSPPSLNRWFLKGFVVDLLRSDNEQMLHTKQNDSSMEYLYTQIRNNITNIKDNYSLWEKFIGLSAADFEVRSGRLVQKANERVSKIITDRYKIIADSPLSQPKIDTVKQHIYEVWNKSALINNLFKLYNCKKTLLRDFPHANRFGSRYPAGNLKEHLAEANPRGIPMTGLEEFGRYLCKLDERLFYLTATKYNERNFMTDSVIQALNDGIAELSKYCYPNVIIMHSHLFTDNQVYNSTDFVPNWKIQDKITEEIRYSLFKDIKVFMSYNNSLQKKIIICNLPKAFEVIKSTEFYDESVFLDFIEIDDDLAKEIIGKNPEKWKTDESGTELKEEQRINRVKNNLLVDTWLYHEYVVSDKNAFLIYNISGEVF